MRLSEEYRINVNHFYYLMEYDTYWLDLIEKIHCDIDKAKLLSIKYFIPKRTQTQHIKVSVAFWKSK